MHFATTPPCASILERAIAKYGVSIASTSSGSVPSDAAVNPTRSTNSAETTLRSWDGGGGAAMPGLYAGSGPPHGRADQLTGAGTAFSIGTPTRLPYSVHEPS